MNALILFVFLLCQRTTFVAQNTTPAGGGGSPAYVAAAAASQAGSVTGPLVINYTPTHAGDALWYLEVCGTVSASNTLTDSTGTPSVVTSAQAWNAAGGGGIFEVWRLGGISGSAHTITYTVPSGAYCNMLVAETSGSTTVGNIVLTSNGGSNANPIPCGSLTTSAGSIILAFGMVFDGSQTFSAGSGPPTFTFPTPAGTALAYTGFEYSGLTTATTNVIASGFVTTATAAPNFCYAVEAKP